MDQKQDQAVQLAKSGHSFFLTGSAGTGKTRTLKTIINSLQFSAESIVVCGATGLSSLILSEGLNAIRAETLHRAFGLMDGRLTAEQVIKLYAGEDEYYVTRRKRLSKVKLLIIDEISMISSHTLNIVNRVLQFVKSSDNVMGEVQSIFCGDFHQLPPVGNEVAGDIGKPAITSSMFKKYVPHTVTLETIHRSSDARLWRAVRELSKGECSTETEDFLKQRSTDLKTPSGSKPDGLVVLYGQRINAEMYNDERLEEVTGQMFRYDAVDSQIRSSEYRNFLPDKNLRLKVGVPIMLLKNLSDEMVNGLRGTVVKLTEDSIHVTFPPSSRCHTLSRVKFTRYDSRQDVEISRTQFPVTLCYATTVHKSQGMTAAAVEVHAEDMWYPGLLPVAISRASNPQYLQVINFRKSLVIPPSKAVLKALEEPAMDPIRDLTCCRCHDFSIAEDEFDFCMTESEDELMMASETVPPTEAAVVPSVQSASPNSMAVADLLLSQAYLSPVTDKQNSINSDILFLKDNINLKLIHEFMEDQLECFHLEILAGNVQNNVANGVIFSSFAETIFKFKTTELTAKMVEENIPNQYHYYLRVMFSSMCSRYLNTEADRQAERSSRLARTSASAQPSTSLQTSDAARGVIRKIGGRTVFKCIKQMSRRLRLLRGKTTTATYKLCKRVKHAFETVLKTSESEARSGRYPDTVSETARGDIKGTRTHITDSAYELFLQLNEARDRRETLETGMTVGPVIYEVTYNYLLNDVCLREKLGSLFPGQPDPILLEEVWRLLLQRYLPVGNNEFRKRMLNALQQQRKQSHRSKISAMEQTSTEKRSASTRKRRKASETENDDCKAQYCKVRRGKMKLPDTLHWIECEKCQDWYHVVCTTMKKGITQQELAAIEWACVRCNKDQSK